MRTVAAICALLAIALGHIEFMRAGAHRALGTLARTHPDAKAAHFDEARRHFITGAISTACSVAFIVAIVVLP